MADVFGLEHHNIADPALDQSKRCVQAGETAADDAHPCCDAPIRRGPQRWFIDGGAVIADGWSGHRCVRQGLMAEWKSTKPTKPIALAPSCCSPVSPCCARYCCGN